VKMSEVGIPEESLIELALPLLLIGTEYTEEAGVEPVKDELLARAPKRSKLWMSLTYSSSNCPWKILVSSS